MILCGAQIHRDGHGKCGLLPNPTLSSNTAQLPSSGTLANTRRASATLLSLIATSHREIQHMSNSKDRKPFHVTRARCRVLHVPRA